MTPDSLEQLRLRLREFTQARDWQRFHTPKNLAMALIAEAAELVEHFQWLTPEQSEALAPSARAEVAGELADILLYTLLAADRLGIDLVEAAHRKLEFNERRYPAAELRGPGSPASGQGAGRDGAGR